MNKINTNGMIKLRNKIRRRQRYEKLSFDEEMRLHKQKNNEISKSIEEVKSIIEKNKKIIEDAIKKKTLM